MLGVHQLGQRAGRRRSAPGAVAGDGQIEESLTRLRRHDELSVGVNWFFSGHDNKLTAELSWLVLQDGESELEEGGRFRLQWDIQF